MKKILSCLIVSFFITLPLKPTILYLKNETNKTLYIKSYPLNNLEIHDFKIKAAISPSKDNYIDRGVYLINDFLLSKSLPTFYEITKDGHITIALKEGSSHCLVISVCLKIEDDLSRFYTTYCLLVYKNKNSYFEKELECFCNSKNSSKNPMKLMDKFNVVNGALTICLMSDRKIDDNYVVILDDIDLSVNR